MSERDFSGRFWSKVDQSGGSDACWPWTAAKTDEGYGTFTIFYRTHYAHRVAYEMEVGPIPDGHDLDHTCHNGTGCQGGRSCPHRACVNPTHLEPVTHRANVLIGEGLTAAHARKAHCKRGHLLTEKNVYRPPGRPNSRVCRKCKQAHDRKRWAKWAGVAIFEEADGG